MYLLQAFVVVGDYNGHCGLGVKCAKEVATAIRGACMACHLWCTVGRCGVPYPATEVATAIRAACMGWAHIFKAVDGITGRGCS